MLNIEGFQRLQCHIKGRRLLMHADTLCDPLHPKTKAMKKLSGERKKTDKTHEQMADIEWEAGLYYDPEIGPYIPGANILRMLQEAGKATKQGTAVKRSVFILEEEIPLGYAGPRKKEKLAKDAAFRDRRSVVVSRSRVMRTRPIFRDWELTFTLLFADGSFNVEELTAIVERAGIMVGLGDYRPTFGRFDVLEAQAA